jgi:hypothetical protein
VYIIHHEGIIIITAIKALIPPNIVYFGFHFSGFGIFLCSINIHVKINGNDNIRRSGVQIFNIIISPYKKIRPSIAFDYCGGEVNNNCKY